MFSVTPYSVNDWIIVRLPKEVSSRFSSRGIVMTQGRINGISFRAVLEPDGEGSHWLKIDQILNNIPKTVSVEIEQIKDWDRPQVPEDIAQALAKSPEARNLWNKITPNAQWEWIRWIRTTHNIETRKRRIEVACSKLTSGMRRPCCFNSNVCTEPTVSKNWILLGPTA